MLVSIFREAYGVNRVVLFYDPAFPYDGERPPETFDQRVGEQVTVVGARQLADALTQGDVTCAIFLHGPYFPADAWPAILTHVRQGKGLVHVGGMPFRIPCHWENGVWRQGREHVTYHRQLNIHEVLPVDPEPIDHFEWADDIPLFAEAMPLLSVEPTSNFVLHVSKASHTEEEMGSSGPMDARIYPLVKGMSRDGRFVASPAVLLEYTKGAFAGGRWVFLNQVVRAPFWDGGGVEELLKWAAFAGRGVTEMWLKTTYATYEVGERPTLLWQQQALGALDDSAQWTVELDVQRDNDRETVFTKTLTVAASRVLQMERVTLPVDIAPGFYRVTAKATSDAGDVRLLRQGFWGMDRELLSAGEPLRCDRDYFWKDGKPFPVVGMTYMTSDVARYFLFLPNPHVWDRDFAQMKRAGINLVRTGIWTAWRHMMLADGHMREDILRAIDAFVLTAKRHGIEVTFTFFSFTPEMWEGTNPYLDPRSVEAQKRFITSIASRHRETTNVQWDLINEPSLFDPARTFAGPRSLHDPYEKAAFIRWLEQRHGTVEALRERWQMSEVELPSFSEVSLPEPTEINFDVQDMLTGKNGLVWLDYTLFTMAMHNQWAKSLADSIRETNPGQLVTVGQDEALGAQRPSPFFYAEAVDYTTVHSWWLMDQLLWDGIFTKDPTKPNLVQETGIMYVEQPDGKAKRSEAELRSILERKYAYAFAAGGAGAVQWIWNTNYYMNNANESMIGACRADGSEKPEADVSYDFGAFMSSIRDLFVTRELEDIVAIFPYTNDFSNRPLAFDATTALTRTLAYELKVPFRALGEYHLDDLSQHPPKLIVVPSAHHFSDEALEKLLHVVREHGATLLFTGPISIDSYWRHTGRLADVLGETALRNVRREEVLELNGQLYPVSFGERRIAEVTKEALLDQPDATVQDVPLGKGRLIWCALPLELNTRPEPLAAMYRYALAQAGVARELEWRSGDLPGIFGRKLSFRDGALFVFVSEYARDARLEVIDQATGVAYAFSLEAERSLLFATRKDGQLRAVHRDVTIDVSMTSS